MNNYMKENHVSYPVVLRGHEKCLSVSNLHFLTAKRISMFEKSRIHTEVETEVVKC